MKYLTVIFITLLFILNLVSAVDIVRKDSCTNIIQTCGNCTFSNVTSILYPNGSIQLSQLVMTKTGTVYNLTFCKTQTTGNYIITGSYNPTGLTSTWTTNFLVNSQGKIYSTTDGLVYLGIIAILISIFLLGLYGSLAIPYENNRSVDGNFISINYKKYIKMFAITMTYLSFVAITYFCWNLSIGILEFQELGRWFYVFYRISFIVMIGFIPVMFVMTLINIFKDNNLREKIQRGLTIK